MNFLDLQNEVLSDRFDSSKRPNTKNWLNYRYGRLWGMENWTFKLQTNTLSLTGGNSSVAKGTIGDIIGIWDTSTLPSYLTMNADRPEDLWNNFRSTSGAVYDFTVIGSTIYFDKPADKTKSFFVLSTIPFTVLVNDGDIPLIPSEFHLVLAQGAASHGLRLENDPSWQSFEQDWQQGISDLRSQYLTNIRTTSDFFPAWP